MLKIGNYSFILYSLNCNINNFSCIIIKKVTYKFCYLSIVAVSPVSASISTAVPAAVPTTISTAPPPIPPAVTAFLEEEERFWVGAGGGSNPGDEGKEEGEEEDERDDLHGYAMAAVEA